MKHFLPIGTVVKIRGYDEPIMIYGRAQVDVATLKQYDYVGCEYPLGQKNATEGVLFNSDSIVELFYVGFQDAEEIEYRHLLSEKIAEAENQPDS